MDAPAPRVSRADIITAIRATRDALGYPPSRKEVLNHAPLAARHITHWFPSWTAALGAAGLHTPPRASKSRRRRSNGALPPLLGRPLLHPIYRNEPVNEQGVVLLFGIMARELGFVIEHVQTGFPDCEALRQTDNGRWRRVRVEFELDSRSFVTHGHDVSGCDIIVCWRHNWPACPESIEVLELSSRLRDSSARRADSE